MVFSDGGQNYPLVAVVRPPLSNSSFGLALGIVQPTGQIRFTFGRDEAMRLKTFAISARQTSAAARRIISADPSPYLERLNADRHYACAGGR